MPIQVPTITEFNSLVDTVDALEARVTALEHNTNPIPEPIPPGEGIQAKRIADMIEKFGVNTFSSMDTGNVWGSWPADYRPETVIAALNWMVGGTGFTFSVREYHYKSRTDMQTKWFNELKLAFPNMRNMMCIGANGSVDDVESMIDFQANNEVTYVEGLNEPNTDFGSGEVPYTTTKAIQDTIMATTALYDEVLGPSIVAGTPHPEGWIVGYCGDQAGVDALDMAIGNGHYYPPGAPDVPNTGYSINEYIGGLWSVYSHVQISLTEFHPTLYNSEGHGPSNPGWSGARDAYYTLTTLFRVAENGTHSLWWYALFDYGTVYKCGLYPTNNQNPRETAFGLRALCKICADNHPTNRTFAAGKLDFSFIGADANTTVDLYENSAGQFFIALWRSLPEPGGDSIPIAFTFPVKPQKIEEFNISKIAGDKQSNNYTAVQVNTSRDGKLTSQLDGSARILRITVQLLALLSLFRYKDSRTSPCASRSGSIPPIDGLGGFTIGPETQTESGVESERHARRNLSGARNKDPQ